MTTFELKGGIVMEYYSVKHKNKKIQMASSSGGAFTALSDVILSLSGKIVGETV